MEIKEVTSKEIWEDFITSFSPSSLFQSWNWGEVMKKSQILWKWGIYDYSKLIGIAQIVKVTAKRGTFLHVRHGPIFSSWQKKYFDFLLKNLKSLAKKEKALFIRISPLKANSIENQSFLNNYGFHDAPIHRMDAEVTWVINLRQNEDTILANMRKTTRYLIKQAQKMGVEIIQKTDIKEIDKFLKLYKITSQRQHFVQHQGIREEFEIFSKDGEIILFEGFHQKKLLAAALIIFYKNQAIYHHSASIEQKIPVNYLLQWEAIKEAKRRNKLIYNMWGIADEKNKRHPWRGLTTFKIGFGGERIEYLHTQDLPLSFLYCATFIVETVRKILKGY